MVSKSETSIDHTTFDPLDLWAFFHASRIGQNTSSMLYRLLSLHYPSSWCKAPRKLRRLLYLGSITASQLRPMEKIPHSDLAGFCLAVPHRFLVDDLPTRPWTCCNSYARSYPGLWLVYAREGPIMLYTSVALG